VQTRTELAELQARLAVTTVYVTHDQVEAMTMGHRVAVLRDGLLQQCDTPHALYHEPVNLFVAGFIGSPAMNLYPCAFGERVLLAGCPLDFDTEITSRLTSFGGDRLVVGFRPEAVRVGEGPLAAHVRTVEDLGSEAFVHVAFDHESETVSAVSKMPAPFKGVTGDPIDMQLTGTVHVFDPGGPRIATGTARFAA
jgi:multiple sugar transport system ATP-binding protein